MNHADVKRQLADYLEGDLGLNERARLDAPSTSENPVGGSWRVWLLAMPAIGGGRGALPRIGGGGGVPPRCLLDGGGFDAGRAAAEQAEEVGGGERYWQQREHKHGELEAEAEEHIH